MDRETGDHITGPYENEEGEQEIKLDPTPMVRKPTDEDWERGCRALGLNPSDGLAGQPPRPAYPGDEAAEAFFQIALENGDEYDLSTMPQSYAAAALTGVFSAWRRRYMDANN
jgi:hypothetical protein